MYQKTSTERLSLGNCKKKNATTVVCAGSLEQSGETNVCSYEHFFFFLEFSKKRRGVKPTLWEVTGDSSSFFTPCRFTRVSRLYLSPVSGVRFPDNTSSSVAVCFDFAMFATLCSSSTFPLCLFFSPSHLSSLP